MHPYQQHHYAGGPPGQPQRQYQANQLPPMYPAPGQPGPSSIYQAAGYQTVGQHPQQTQNIQPQAQQPNPKFLARSNGKHTFELRVEQQPQRARMCGFGDKDRRPITPPPCIKLVITDLNGNLVPTSQIDGSFFVLQVDLWDDEAVREVNIVRSSSTTPAVSISTATTTSYPPVTERQVAIPQQQVVGYTMDGRAIYEQVAPAYPGAGVMGYGNQYYQPPFPGPTGPAQYPMPTAGQPPTSTSMYTRNLIGSLSVNSSILKDPDGNEAYWFVLQDLSVRTEGWFRLRMQFYDVSNPHGEGVTKGIAPCLALVYSDKFQVYSAKKFPGVIESTPLSKCFAQQGIKIPIRKDMKLEEVPDDD